MKGLFIPGITAEMFRNGSLESIEELMAEGEIYDIDHPTESEERMGAYAEERLRKAVRNYVEVNPRLESMKSWVYTLDGEKYAVKVKVCKFERSEEDGRTT